ncbi:hypothetical protein TB2_002692 [Malus domestica]
MESTLSAATPTTAALLAVSKSLNRRLERRTFLSQRLPSRLLARRHLTSVNTNYYGFQAPKPDPFSSSSLRSVCVAGPLLRRRLECVGSSNPSFASGGGNGGFGGESGGSGGDGEGGSGGGDAKSKVAAAGGDEVSALSTDVIVLDVGGMTCGGCAASVKRILENQPQVSSATVNLTTETAIVWPVSEAKATPNWQKQLGETLANQLTSCGFKSNLRGSLNKQLIVVDKFAEHFCYGAPICSRGFSIPLLLPELSNSLVVIRTLRTPGFL